MSGAALALVLTAAVLHATWNLAVKGVTADRVTFVWTYVCLTVAIWLPIAVGWVLVTGETPTWQWPVAALVSGGLHVVYQLVLQRGYAEGDLNLVYPVARGTGPLLTLLVAVTVLGEHPGPVAVTGVLAVGAGVVLISAGGGRLSWGPGLVWGLATGATIAAYTLWDNRSVNTLHVPPLPYFTLGAVLQLGFLAVLLARRTTPTPVRRVWAETRRLGLVVAVCSPLAYVLVLRAMQLAPVALVAAGREASIVIGAGFAWLVLREAHPARRLVGAGVVLAGIALIAVA